MGCEEMDNQNHVYVDMMLDSLRRKRKILSALLDETKEQEMLLRSQEFDYEKFQVLLETKGKQIEELNQIDVGFDGLFKKVEQEIRVNREDYCTEIQQMQQLIAEVSECGVSVQALERQNSEQFKVFLSEQRKNIRNYHLNKKTAASYYQNLSNTHRPEQSYFFNKKK